MIKTTIKIDTVKSVVGANDNEYLLVNDKYYAYPEDKGILIALVDKEITIIATTSKRGFTYINQIEYMMSKRYK